MSTSNPTAAEINQAYQSYLGRPADVGGLDWYLNSGKSLDEIRADLAYAGGTTIEQPTYGATSTEYIDPFAQYYQEPSVQENQFIAQRIASQTDPGIAAIPVATPASPAPTQDDVVRAYQRILGRDPEPEAISFYTNPANLSTGAGLTGIPALQALLADSPEGRAKAAATAAGSTQAAGTAGSAQANIPLSFSSVPELYKAIYGRDPDPEGLSFYQQQFGQTIEPEEIDRFISGARGQDLPTAQNALDYLNRTGDEAGARRILDASVGNTPLTRDILQLYRPELANPFAQLFPTTPPKQEQTTPRPGETQPRNDLGLIPGSIVPRSGTDIQRVLASYSPESIGAKFATGYQQVFGRDIDPAGAEYWLSRFGNRDLSQAEVNRYLLGGASGEDKAASKPYEMSLTGGRPLPGDPQFFQPIYSPEYKNYMPTRQVEEKSVFGQAFNPFDYTNIAPTPLTYTGFDPTSINYQSNLSNLARYAQPIVASVPTDEGIAAPPTATP